MIYQRCRINTTVQSLDDVIAALSAAGFDQIEVESTAEFQYQLENRHNWELIDDDFADSQTQNAVTVYTQDDTQTQRLRECVCPLLDCHLTITKVDEQDWADAWQQYYRPIDIGERLRIQPAWLDCQDIGNRRIFYNNPGMSFGTGTHASTLLCLEMLESNIQGSERVLDIGCGSGILFISALLLGAGEAFAIDIDPMACQIAEENAVANKATNYKIQQGDFTANPEIMQAMFNFKPDIICANLVADLLVDLAPYIKRLLAPGGKLIASGIIDKHAKRVEESLGLQITQRLQREGWTTLKGEL